MPNQHPCIALSARLEVICSAPMILRCGPCSARCCTAALGHVACCARVPTAALTGCCRGPATKNALRVQIPAGSFSNPEMADTERRCLAQQRRAAQRAQQHDPGHPSPARPCSRPWSAAELHGDSRMTGGHAHAACGAGTSASVPQSAMQRPRSAHAALNAELSRVRPTVVRPGARQQGRLHAPARTAQPSHHPCLTPGPGEYFSALGLAVGRGGSKGGKLAQTSREQDMRCAHERNSSFRTVLRVPRAYVTASRLVAAERLRSVLAQKVCQRCMAKGCAHPCPRPRRLLAAARRGQRLMGVTTVVKPVSAPPAEHLDVTYNVNDTARGHWLRVPAVHLPPNRIAASERMLHAVDERA